MIGWEFFWAGGARSRRGSYLIVEDHLYRRAGGSGVFSLEGWGWGLLEPQGPRLGGILSSQTAFM
jgi:hypothetical protein